jgi:hypothetical protein
LCKHRLRARLVSLVAKYTVLTKMPFHAVSRKASGASKHAYVAASIIQKLLLNVGQPPRAVRAAAGRPPLVARAAC